MTRLQELALAMAGIVVSGIGLFLGTAFAMPALGLNVYGHNPLEFTIAIELVSAAIYLAGATMSWFAWDAIGKRGLLRGQAALLAMPVVVLVVALAFDVVRAYWISLVETLVFVAGVLLPALAASRPWMRGRGLFGGH
jgi:hypothetical protein